jgi:hypothetical protein
VFRAPCLFEQELINIRHSKTFARRGSSRHWESTNDDAGEQEGCGETGTALDGAKGRWTAAKRRIVKLRGFGST